MTAVPGPVGTESWLRAAVEALADEWERPLDGARQRANTGADFADIGREETLRHRHAHELRTLLAAVLPAPVGDERASTAEEIATELARKVCSPACEHHTCVSYRYAAHIARQHATTTVVPAQRTGDRP